MADEDEGVSSEPINPLQEALHRALAESEHEVARKLASGELAYQELCGHRLLLEQILEELRNLNMYLRR